MGSCPSSVNPLAIYKISFFSKTNSGNCVILMKLQREHPCKVFYTKCSNKLISCRTLVVMSYQEITKKILLSQTTSPIELRYLLHRIVLGNSPKFVKIMSLGSKLAMPRMSYVLHLVINNIFRKNC